MTTERLFVEFCEGEKQARMEKIIEELAQIERWEDAKSGATKHYNEMIKEADARIKGWRSELDAGGTEEDVDVEWKMDDPEKGQKTLYRLDTMEPIRMEEMGLFDSRKSEPDPPTPEAVDDGEDESDDVTDEELAAAMDRECSKCGKMASDWYSTQDGILCDECYLEGEEQTDPPTPEAMEDGEVCCKCGAADGNGIYHIADGPICRNCIINRNHKKYVELNERIVKCREAGKPLLFRASFGYGVCSDKADLVCFRFRDFEHGWGLDIYEPGKVDDHCTSAGKVYAWLLQNGAQED